MRLLLLAAFSWLIGFLSGMFHERRSLREREAELREEVCLEEIERRAEKLSLELRALRTERDRQDEIELERRRR